MLRNSIPSEHRSSRVSRSAFALALHITISGSGVFSRETGDIGPFAAWCFSLSGGHFWFGFSGRKQVKIYTGFRGTLLSGELFSQRYKARGALLAKGACHTTGHI